MQYAFKTNSAIPLDAFTTLGVNVKVKENAIGKFGTGLKYAVAVILRLGGTFEVWIDGVQHVFYKSPKKFRNVEFEMVRMKKAKGLLAKSGWVYTKLPFTIELGKEWELWQAFRELESNTRDEDGDSFEIDDDYVVSDTGTTIIIRHDDLREVFDSENPTFLPEDRNLVWENDVFQIFEGRSKVLYFQGIRCYDIRNESKYTYNFKSGVQLTEDRTIKNIWSMEWELVWTMQRHISDLDLLRSILKKEDGYTYETHDLPIHNNHAGDTFRSTIYAMANDGTLGYQGGMFYREHLSSPPLMTRTISLQKAEWEEIEQVLREAGRDDLASKVEVG